MTNLPVMKMALVKLNAVVLFVQGALFGVQVRNAFETNQSAPLMGVALIFHVFWIWIAWRGLMDAASNQGASA